MRVHNRLRRTIANDLKHDKLVLNEDYHHTHFVLPDALHEGYRHERQWPLHHE